MANDPGVGQKALIHLLVPNANGPIEGSYGQKYAVACVPTSQLPKHATGECVNVTCARCKLTPEFAAVQEKQRPGVAADQLAEADRQ